VRISKNDRGIVSASNDLSNPPVCDPEIGVRHGYASMLMNLIVCAPSGPDREFEAPSRRLRHLRLPRPHQRLRLGDLGRCHPWRLMRQFVSNGLKYGSELEGLLKRLMRPQPLGRK
jgi:hypothetical protein